MAINESKFDRFLGEFMPQTYESEFTKFMRDFKQQRPQLEEEQRKSREIWWDHKQNLDAAARLMAALPGAVTLTLYGTGTQSEALQRRFAAVLPPGGLRRIHFAGPTHDVRAALAAADGYLMTSRYEGQSLAMLEAMEYGLPVLSTLVGGATGMALAHPMMEILALDDAAGLRDSAERVLACCRGWMQDSARASQRIHEAWARHYSIGFFDREIRKLWDEVTADGVTDTRAALQGYGG